MLLSNRVALITGGAGGIFVIHYNSAKAGVLGFIYDLAGALGPFKINVNAIIAGLIQTAFYDALIEPVTGEQKQAFFESLGKMAPLGRIGTPSKSFSTRT